MFTKSALKDPAGTATLAEDKVYIREDLPEDLQRTTALHEVLHLTSDHLHLDLSEAQISGLACGLKGVLSENKPFCDWLVGKSKRGKA